MACRQTICCFARLTLVLSTTLPAQDAPTPIGRRPVNDEQLGFWLDNALVHHRLSSEETAAALGMSVDEVRAAAQRLDIDANARPQRGKDEPLVLLPYPGGRHPRIGFLDGAVDPQRETKISIFATWQNGGYAVADVPEAIWHETPAGRELLYLAHTHVPTIWDKQGVKLERLEWTRSDDGWQVERTLPNKVVFGTRVTAKHDHVELNMWLQNGTAETLRGLVVQNCVMLKGLAGFDSQTNDNKLLRKPYVACHSADRSRWIVTAWEPCHRPWANPPCPCLHSDPKFPDCEPGKTVRTRGWLSFYEGPDIDAELKRIESLKWHVD